MAARLGSLHPDALTGIHLNFLLAQPPDDPGPKDEEAIARRTAFDATEFAYAQIQGTKPDSLTVAQADSPAGLAAWIVEKFHAWSAGRDVLETFPADVLLTVASFPDEPWRVPRHWAEPRFDLRRWTDMPRGGHFAALEEPELLTADVRAFFRESRDDAARAP